MHYLIGKSLKHSMSPFIYGLMGLKYEVLEIKDESCVLKYITEKNYHGLNITIPYKECVIAELDSIDDVAQNIGAVNTIVNKNGKLIGYNTDVFGLEYALNSFKITIRDKKVLILGSGGTAKTASYVCKKMGAKSINIVSRHGQINYQNCYDKPQDVIINTTPVGMYPDNFGQVVDLSKFAKLSGVFDAVYNPLKTSLIMQAESLHIPCGNGLVMLVAQAIKARELFCNNDNIYDIDDICHNLSYHMNNIILIGMPGSGKSSVGALLAEKLGREFVDTDTQVENQANAKISDVFREKGESCFRKMEEEALNNALKSTHKVIATGGGCVISCKNRGKIRQSGFVVWLKRDIENLDLTNRPLSRFDKVKGLYTQREPYYKELANLMVVNVENDIEKTVKYIRSSYEKNTCY